MKYLLFLCLVGSAHAAVVNFEDSNTGPFKRLEYPSMVIETGFDSVSFIGDEPGRPEHFQTKSLFTSKSITVTLTNPSTSIVADVAAFKHGSPKISCNLIYKASGKPYPYPMNSFIEEMTYPEFGQVYAIPFAKFLVTKCVINSSPEGVWIDNITTGE